MTTTVLIVALSLLAFPACSIREPTDSARTPAQIVARVMSAHWWEFVLWAFCAGLVPFALAAWWATRSTVFNAAAGGAWLLAKVATWSSADGRRYRLTRTEGMRALLA